MVMVSHDLAATQDLGDLFVANISPYSQRDNRIVLTRCRTGIQEGLVGYTQSMTISSDKPKPKKRWHQFGIWSLLGLMVAAAVGFGLLKWKLQPAERQRQAVAYIENLGGAAYYDFELDESGNYILLAKPSTPEWLLSCFGKDFFHQVLCVYFGDHELYIWNPTVTDVDLKHLTGLTHVKVLDLSGTQVSDVGLDHLARLTKLENLYLLNTQVTDAAVQKLSKGQGSLACCRPWGHKESDTT